MKSAKVNLVLATAALMMSSAAASAQTLKAEIPFPFLVAGKVMAAGTYMFSGTEGQSRFMIWNTASRDVILVLPRNQTDPDKTWLDQDGGVLQFVCSDGCVLGRIWTHTGSPAHDFYNPKAQAGKPTHLALIRLGLTGAGKH